MADESDETLHHGLGRRFAADPNDQRYLLPRRAANATTASSKYWYAPPALDQGATSSCVGHAWHQYLKCSPVRNIKNIPDPYAIYNAAQLIDEWPGVGYDGTSVRAGCKVLRAQGYISGYSWAFDGPTVVNHLLNVGPVVIGVDFYSGMMTTDNKGFVYPRGRLVGGHAVPLIGVSTTGKCPDGRVGFATFLNSWSRDWGAINGRGRIALEDLDNLIRAQGEACVAHEVLKPVPTA